MSSQREKRPNEVLRHVRAVERNQSRREFALSMEDAARELGENVACTERYVARLEDGVIQKVGPAYRRVLERATGRPFAELGFLPVNGTATPVVEEQPAEADDAAGLGTLDDALAHAAGLWRSDVERRDFLRTAVFSSTPMIVPGMDFVVQPPDRDVARQGRHKVRMADVQLVRDVSAQALELDAKHGGARLRASLVAFLDSEAVEMLNGTYTDEVGRALLSATSEATYVAGWMAFDTGRHAVAQRYYTQALRFAQAAGDRMLGSEIISYMSYLAQDAGSYPDAVRLARAAVAADPRTSDAHRAHLHSFEAWALASLGDARGTEEAIGRAAEAFAAASPGHETSVSGASLNRPGLLGLFGHCYIKLGETAKGEAVVTQALGEVTAPRDRAFVVLHSANLATQRGDADAAASLASQALDGMGVIGSARVHAELEGFRANLAALGQSRAGDEFEERLREADILN